MLDMYDFNNDVWLCHSYGGKCYNFTAFVSASNYIFAKLNWYYKKNIVLKYLESVWDFACGKALSFSNNTKHFLLRFIETDRSASGS